jgi:uncharacterized phage protein gp47/JayE
MSTTYPLPTLAATISSTGITAPSYNDILLSLQASFRSIYGSDAYLEADSQDGQLLAVFARAINDANMATISVYNAYSPQTAQGVALSNQVKMNGIARLVASASQVNVTITGTVGTVIANGVVKDTNQNLWNLPASVTIPNAGAITVTATSQVLGAIAAGVNTVNSIMTPILGWQSVTNPTAASPGNPVETDAALRQRQKTSVALPSLTVLAGIVGAVESVAGVSLVQAYENDTGATDANGLPPHSIALVVQGGDSEDIARAILAKKTPGAYTHGTTSQSILDPVGIPQIIRYFVPTLKPVVATITIRPINNYTTVVGGEIKAAVSSYIAGLGIGQDVMLSRLYLPAQLNGAPDSMTYEVVGITMAISPNPQTSADLVIAFNELATCSATDVAIVTV